MNKIEERIKELEAEIKHLRSTSRPYIGMPVITNHDIKFHLSEKPLCGWEHDISAPSFVNWIPNIIGIEPPMRDQHHFWVRYKSGCIHRVWKVSDWSSDITHYAYIPYLEYCK